MKILHTSDWHLGRALYGRRRYEEFSAFLDWLLNTIQENGVDVLLVAGDIFDTATPSNRAQELYYSFLCRIATTCCRHVVIIAGNHDSPSFLQAPKALLRVLNVHVIGAVSECLEDELVVLQTDTTPQAIVCAVPYLRDKDIRHVEAGESIEDKNAKLVEGLKGHYAEVCALALQKQAAYAKKGHGRVPIIGMGHLFTTKGKTIDGDGVRELYVGSLVHVGKEIFPSCIDYLALGHLHVPQRVGGAEHIRYSGSPIPMGFGEAKQAKQVLLIRFVDGVLNLSDGESIYQIPVPCFQELVHIKGSLEDIYGKLQELTLQESKAWLDIEYTGSDNKASLHELFTEAIASTSMEIRRIKNSVIMEKSLHAAAEEETLDDLNEHDVFTRCLDVYQVPEEDRPMLIHSYNEILLAMQDEDTQVE